MIFLNTQRDELFGEPMQIPCQDVANAALSIPCGWNGARVAPRLVGVTGTCRVNVLSEREGDIAADVVVHRAAFYERGRCGR